MKNNAYTAPLPPGGTATKRRDSNMELLRIVAMLLILVIHASYRALPFPDAAAINANPSSSLLQMFSRSASIMGVDLFVMLSGWYGIRPRFSRLAELLFQLLFFGVLCLLAEYAVAGQMPCSAIEAVKTVLLLDDGSYWFVKCYLGLYIFAPVLNSFVEHASRRQFATTLCLIFGFQFVFGWVFEAVTWLNAGYSLPSFMCLYLLARYMHIHRPAFTQFSRRTDLCICLGIVVAVTAVVFVARWKFGLGGVLYFYNSPTTILSATFLLLFFSKLSLKSRLVNWVAISALAIYLTHSNNFLYRYYDGSIQKWFYGESRLTFIVYAALLIVAVFVGSILIDKVRLLLWRLITRGKTTSKPHNS